eukprot:743369-Pelagomonas_calceolata.AAC.1
MKYVVNLMKNELAPQIFNGAKQDGNPDSAHNCFFSNIQHAAEMADMVANYKEHDWAFPWHL